MEPPQENLPGIPEDQVWEEEDQVWEEKVENILQISTGVDLTTKESLEGKEVAGDTKESLEGKEVAGDIKEKRKQEEKRTEIREIRRRAKEKGETEAVGERGTKRIAEQKVVSTCVIVKIHKS